MSSLEKLVRALELLRTSDSAAGGATTPSSPVEASLRSSLADLKPTSLLFRQREAALSSREKKQCCCHLAEGVVSAAQRPSPDQLQRHLPAVVETLLQLADDADADVRTAADESLNRIVRGLSENNIGRLLVELYKGIKQGHSPRSVAAALTRFAELSNRIRPQKRRAYVVNLFPCILRLTQRAELAVQESLSAALVKMAPVLGVFFTDGETKAVLQAFLPNLEHSQAPLRRAASAAMVALVSQCRKPETFLPWLLSTLLDWLVPLRPPESESAGRVLGVLLCLRDITPLLEELCDGVSLERLLQLYELLLHLTQHANHNVVTSALDALCQLLRAPPAELLAALITEGALERSRLQPDAAPAVGKANSVLSVAPSLAGEEADLADTDSLLWPAEDPGQDERGAETPPPPPPPPPPVAPAEIEEPPLRVATPPADDVIDPLRYDITCTDETADTASGDTQGSVAGDIGSLTDGGIPLIYCCRLLVSRYLLTGVPKGIRGDREVRVSIKVLCVTCISAAVSLAPDILSLPLLIDKDPESAECQYLWDVLLFVDDADPQLRGAVSLLIGTYLRAAALQPATQGDGTERPAPLRARTLLDHLQQVLLDSSHVSSRQALEGLGQCLEPLLKAPECELLLPLLSALLRLADHSYWLVKVDLCSLVSALPLPELELLWRWGAADDSSYQQLLLDDLLLRLLEDVDQRVQQAAATAIVSYVQRVPVSAEPDGWVSEAAGRQRSALLPPPQPWGTGLRVTGPGRGAVPPFSEAGGPARPELGAALSLVVGKLISTLMMTDSKHMVSGTVLALRALMDKMPATVYPEAWQVNHKRYRRGLYQLCVSMVTSTQLMHDLATHNNLVHLAASLAAGICVRQQRARPSQSREERLRANWDLLEPLVTHVMRVMNIYSHLVGDTQPTTPQNKSSLPSFPTASSLSPIKKRSTPERSKSATSTTTTSTAASSTPAPAPASAASDRAGSQEREEKEADKKVRQAVGFFMSSSEYQKLYSMLKTIYETFKITLNAQSSEKLLGVLSGCLTALGILLELVGTAQVAPLAEELLGYVTGLIRLAPALALHCVLQLLRAMFGSADAARPSGSAGHLSRDASTTSCAADDEPGLYQACVNGPYAELAAFVATSRRLTATNEEGTSPSPRPEYDSRRPGLSSGRSTDKQALASYIRVFEPSVIKALKLYTVTSDPEVQSQVLWLLIQLVQLRVNYCLLDSDQIFIGYVIKQLEYVEEGQMKEGNQVIPAIFRFLVALSYERYHSKTIVSIPKVIQLCDGLIASGQPPETYALPALRPIVEDLFVSARPSVQDAKELEAQKEVLLSMLLRLIQYPEVLELVSLAVCESRRDGEERWRLASRAVLDALLPPLLQLHVRLDSPEALAALHRLLAALCPRALRPAEDLLSGLLRHPVGVVSGEGLSPVGSIHDFGLL
ncbi:huntingtin-like [Amphibalanus amphitrite]|uniref:huntingtin-like n=1 Tax=Amphibalanus amphitrite TaxID=1232801 RepID=UPI001C9232F0|nr:huntingtin-like [Amphibalanus amphitrite]